MFVLVPVFKAQWKTFKCVCAHVCARQSYKRLICHNLVSSCSDSFCEQRWLSVLLPLGRLTEPSRAFAELVHLVWQLEELLLCVCKELWDWELCICILCFHCVEMWSVFRAYACVWSRLWSSTVTHLGQCSLCPSCSPAQTAPSLCTHSAVCLFFTFCICLCDSSSNPIKTCAYRIVSYFLLLEAAWRFVFLTYM